MDMAAVAIPPTDIASENSRIAAKEIHDYLQARQADTSGPTSFDSIPIIDLTPSFSASLSDRQKVGKQINEACTTAGFFYITGHGIPQSVCEKVFTLCARFFGDLSPESKEAIHMRNTGQFRGYEPPHYTSSTDFTREESKEAFNWGYEYGLDPTGGDGKYVELDGTSAGGKNQWPEESEIPGFYDGIRDYYARILQLCKHLFRLFALSLSLPENYFDSMITHPGGIGRLIKYRPNPNPNPKPLGEVNEEEEKEEGEAELGLGAHSDFECFTLLLQDQVPGLEVLSPNGKWIVAEPLEGGIIVNIADFFMRWTNGLYKSTIHRVVNRTDRTRYSVPVFYSINYDEIVETIPSCVSEENPSKYPPISAGQYILNRLALTAAGN